MADFKHLGMKTHVWRIGKLKLMLRFNKEFTLGFPLAPTGLWAQPVTLGSKIKEHLNEATVASEEREAKIEQLERS
jgi:hypothetical protein